MYLIHKNMIPTIGIPKLHKTSTGIPIESKSSKCSPFQQIFETSDKNQYSPLIPMQLKIEIIYWVTAEYKKKTIVIIVKTIILFKFVFQKQSLIRISTMMKNIIAKKGEPNINKDFTIIQWDQIYSSSSKIQFNDMKISLSCPFPLKGCKVVTIKSGHLWLIERQTEAIWLKFNKILTKIDNSLSHRFHTFI